MDVGWVTLFIDRPSSTLGAARDFWRGVTATEVSANRGERGEFATFVPPDGDAYLRLQEVADGTGGVHLDFHVPDVSAAADEAVATGAIEIAAPSPDLVSLRSPGGLVFCCVRHRGEARVPAPVGVAGERTIVDQLCVDVAPEAFDREVEFWATITGWATRSSSVSTSFASLVRPVGIPVRLMFQRCGDDRAGQPAGGHLDLACDDHRGAAAAHLAAGAELVVEHAVWTVMRDPAGFEYCLTFRDPDTGLPPAD